MSAKIHRTKLRVLYGDTDAAGVVYNANYLRYFELGRTELMRDWVCSYREIEKMGFILPVIECWTRFKASAHYDDELVIETSVAEASRLKCKFNYRAVRIDPKIGKAKLLVKGYTVHAAITRAGKLTQLPDEIIKKIANLAQPSENNSSDEK